MALIGTIRKNGWILIAVMVLSLGGFILMDVIKNSSNYSAGDVNMLGKVNGEEIKRSEFDSYEKLVYSNAKGNTFQVRSQVWNYFVEGALVKQEAEKVGLGVSKDELLDLEFGANLSPVVADRFKGADGQPNRQTLAGIKSAIESGQFTDPTNRAYWSTQEKEVIKKRLEDKLTAMVTKGLYAPTWLAETVFAESNEHVDYTAVRIPYEKVTDDEAKLTDDDYKAFLKENPHLYDQPEEARLINYLSIDVIPTATDSVAARDAVAKLVEGLRTAASDSAFVTSHDGVYDPSYKIKAGLPPAIADTLLRLPLNTVVGPYLDGGVWTIAKILDRKTLPDSVRARHILIREASPASERRIDSLMTLIKTGKASFDSLAIKNSQDGGSGAKGGDLGYFSNGMMVPEFNNICFYTGEQGKLYKVATQFGWHLIEITGKKFIKNDAGVKAVYLSERIEPSKQTQTTAKERAEAVVQNAKTLDALTTMANQLGLSVQAAPMVKANDYALGILGSGDDVRSIIQWAFNAKTKEGTVSQEIFSFRDASGGYFDTKYVVAALKSIAPKGAASVATLKSMPDAEQKVKNRKKGEVLKSKLQNQTDMNALATQWGVKVDTMKTASFLQTSGEPRVIGTVFNLTKGAVSAPIAGNSGVFVVSPISDPLKPEVPADLSMFRRQVLSSTLSNVRQNLLNSMKKAADIKDNRSRFF
jgi:peptidyl-prolyl cis-trans isomerase D